MELTDVIKGGTAAAAVYGISKTPKLDDIKVKKDGDKTDKEMKNLLGSKDRTKEFIAPFESTLTAEKLAEILQVPLELVASKTTENASRLFHI